VSSSRAIRFPGPHLRTGRASSPAVSRAGISAALDAAACYAASYVYARRLLTNRGTQPLVLAAAQLTAGTVLLGAATPWIERHPVELTQIR
jgi:drug/metabolite transporter (DMT)-like permease